MKKTSKIIFCAVTLLVLIPFSAQNIFSEETIDELFELAYNYENNTDYENALRYFDKIIELEPENAESLNGKGAVFLKINNLEQSKIYIDKALEIDPNYIKALNNKGVLFGKQENFAEATKYFDKVLQLDPNNVDALLNKANIAGFEQDFEEVLVLLNHVLQIDPDNRKAIDYKSLIYDSVGRETIDGYVQTILRDKDGNLIGYLETDNILKALHSETDSFILKVINPDVTKTIQREGKDYSLVFNRIDSEAIEFNKIVQTGVGIAWLDKRQSEVIDFPILFARHHGFFINDHDRTQNYWQLILEK